MKQLLCTFSLFSSKRKKVGGIGAMIIGSLSRCITPYQYSTHAYSMPRDDRVPVALLQNSSSSAAGRALGRCCIAVALAWCAQKWTRLHNQERVVPQTALCKNPRHGWEGWRYNGAFLTQRVAVKRERKEGHFQSINKHHTQSTDLMRLSVTG